MKNRWISLSIIFTAVALMSFSCGQNIQSDSSANRRFPSNGTNQGGTTTPSSNQSSNGLPAEHWQTIQSQYQGTVQVVDIDNSVSQQSFSMIISERTLDNLPFAYVQLQSNGTVPFTFEGYMGILPGTACTAAYCFQSEIKTVNTLSTADLTLTINLGFSLGNNNQISFIPQQSTMGFTECSFGSSCNSPLSGVTFQLQ